MIMRGKRYRSDGINSFGSSLIARPSFSAVDTKRRSDEEDGQCCHELHLIQVWVSSPEVIEIRSLKPFDLYTIGNSVKKTHRALIDVPTPYAGTLEEWTVVQPAQIVTAVEQLCQ
ncbi:hypothetical protein Bca52824_009524 [Brassica carinata]|uniref:Pyruvate dehydrogenase E1 component subunit beta n=1 Tax=Brassica carinata TaxID=52824 RepID=A0A8X7WBA9_BRACI|nr:hypothetical protein Bca52824_009524 [Brassica carinata]